jgi:hypothetical protein
MNTSIGKRSLEFDSSGFLKEGTHDCTLADLQVLTFTNCHRRNLGKRLMSFLHWTVRLRGFSHIYCGGGFLSARSYPQDIDVVLETKDPFGPEAFAAVEPFFMIGLDNIRNQYSVHVHFWMESAPKSMVDYRAFFQYVRPKKRRRFLFGQRGIVRLALCATELAEQWAPESLSQADRAVSNIGGTVTDMSEREGASFGNEGLQSQAHALLPMARSLPLIFALIFSLVLSPDTNASEGDETDSNLVDARLNNTQGYPKFTIPSDYSYARLPGHQYTAKNGSFLITINNVEVPVVYSLPMEGTRLAPSASNLVFYGPYPGEKTQLNKNIVPDIVTKLGCTVFSFQFNGLGQAVSATPYWSEPHWFDAALAARNMIAEKYALECRKLILFGYSGGGGMVMNFAGTYPDEIEAVAAQAPNVVPPFPSGNTIKWLMVVNRGDNNRSVMKPFYDKLRVEGNSALYCETTPERSRGHYHEPSNQTFDLIYDFIAGILDQRRLESDGITETTRLWPYAAPTAPLERYAIVKTVNLQPEDLSSGKFDLMPSLAFTIGWSRVCPIEQKVVPAGTRAKLIMNFPAHAVPTGIVLYYDNPSFADVPREVEDINSLAEHGYLVVSSMTAGPDDFVNAATSWIRSQEKLNGLHIHLVGNGPLGAQFISKIAERNDISFKSLCLLDFRSSSYNSDCMESLALAAKECGMYGFYNYSESDEPAHLSDWASDLVDRGAQDRGCFNVRIKPKDSPTVPEAKRHMQAEIQALTMVENLIARVDSH